MKRKPFVFIAASEKGGARKSRSSGMIYHALLEAGYNPLVLALDTNNNLRALLRGQSFITWDINNEDESRRQLELALQIAITQNRPIILDIPAKGGNTLGVLTLLRTGMLKYTAHVVAIVPTLPDAEYAACAVGALGTISPDAWIHFKYKSHELDYQNDAHQLLAALKPNAVVIPPELTDEEANAIAMLPTALSTIEQYVNDSGMRALGCIPYLAYWKEVQPQILKALTVAAPNLFVPLTDAEKAVMTKAAAEETEATLAEVTAGEAGPTPKAKPKATA